MECCPSGPIGQARLLALPATRCSGARLKVRHRYTTSSRSPGIEAACLCLSTCVVWHTIVPNVHHLLAKSIDMAGPARTVQTASILDTLYRLRVIRFSGTWTVVAIDALPAVRIRIPVSIARSMLLYSTAAQNISLIMYDTTQLCPGISI